MSSKYDGSGCDEGRRWGTREVAARGRSALVPGMCGPCIPCGCHARLRRLTGQEINIDRPHSAAITTTIRRSLRRKMVGRGWTAARLATEHTCEAHHETLGTRGAAQLRRSRPQHAAACAERRQNVRELGTRMIAAVQEPLNPNTRRSQPQLAAGQSGPHKSAAAAGHGDLMGRRRTSTAENGA